MNSKTTFTHQSVLIANQYRKIDGRNAYQSNLESLSLGVDTTEGQRVKIYQLIH